MPKAISVGQTKLHNCCVIHGYILASSFQVNWSLGSSRTVWIRFMRKETHQPKRGMRKNNIINLKIIVARNSKL